MSTQILIKRSTTTGAVPTTSDIATGELAINTVDKRIFTNNSGTIVELGTTPTTQAVTGNASVGGTFDVVGAVTVGNFTADGTVDLTSATVTISAPTADTHPATKKYVDDEVNAILDGAPAALDTLNEIAAAINDDANLYTTLTTSIATKLSLSGGTMTGSIDMGANSITTSADPATANTLTRKSYVDGLYQSTVDAEVSAAAAAASATSAANSASSASTSATTATTQASAASTSATNAANSATSAASSATASANSATNASTYATNASTAQANAETAQGLAEDAQAAAEAVYDQFDDRYLGAKASDPSVDNDGNALITGALYFDTTNNVTKVFNGTDWQAASSSIEGIKSDFQYTATASQTVFSGSGLVIDQAGLVNVFLNGVRLADSDYTVNVGGNSVTLASGASAGDIVELEVFGNFAGQSGAEVSITGGSITGLTNFESAGIDDNASSTAMTLDASGNVGIGTSSPVTALDVRGEISVDYNATYGLRFYNQGRNNWSSIGNTDTATGANLVFKSSKGEAMRITPTGNLLVGKTSASTGTAGVQIMPNSYSAFTRDGNTPLYVSRLTSDGNVIEVQKNGTTVGSIGNFYSYLNLGTSDTGILFDSDENNIKPWNMSTNGGQDTTISLGSSGVRFKDLYLSGGVYLGGTGSANYLDDYEEGTWTPTISSYTTNPSVTYVYRSGHYTKVGRLVTVYCDVEASSISGGSGSVQISGLPFNVSTIQARDYPVPSFRDCNAVSNWGGNDRSITGYCQGGSNTVRLQYEAGSSFNSVTIASWSSAGRITFSVTYATT
jgi:hypothetical protein